MTSISSLNASSAALATAAVTTRPPVSNQTPTPTPTTSHSRTIGSSSAANVPSAIAALSLRGAENDAGKDVMINGQEVNDHDGDD